MSVSIYVQHHWRTDEEELNFSNDNFCELMALLGFVPDTSEGLVGTIDRPLIEHMRDEATSLLAMMQAHPSLDSGTETRTVRAPGRATLILCGHVPGYYTLRLEQLITLFDRALTLHAFLVYA